MKYEAVIITGACGGLGRCLSLKFAKEGYNLILNGRNNKNLERLCNEIKKTYSSIKLIKVLGDIRKKETINRIIKVAHHLDTTILINNAGISEYGLISNLTYKNIREIIDVNLIAPIILTKRFYKVCQDKNIEGVIVNILSQSAKSPSPHRAVYCASKSGLMGFSDSISLDSKFLDVISIYPSGMRTKGYKGNKKSNELTKPEIIALEVYNKINKV